MGTTAGLAVGAVDDSPMLLHSLADSMRPYLPEARMGPLAATVGAFLASDPQVDVVMLDMELEDGSDAGENTRRLAARGWPVLIFTQTQRHRMVARAFRAGAAGVLSKGEELDEIARAIRTVAAGEPYLSTSWASVIAEDEEWSVPNLTAREVEAVRLYAAGLKLSAVARRLTVTDDTARTYLLRARGKYAGVGRPASTKTELYVRAVEDGILPAPQPPPGPLPPERPAGPGADGGSG